MSTDDWYSGNEPIHSIVMIRPDGEPANIPVDLVEIMRKRGYVRLDFLEAMFNLKAEISRLKKEQKKERILEYMRKCRDREDEKTRIKNRSKKN